MEWVFVLGLFAIVAVVIWKKIQDSNKIWVCTQCKTVGTAKVKYGGSTGVELLLWLFFIVPGLIYSAWRGSSKKMVCRSCGSESLVPPDSPRGREIAGG